MNISKVNNYNTDSLFQGKISTQQKHQKSIYAGNLRLGNKEDEYLASLMQQLEKNKQDIQEISMNREITPEEKKEKLKELQLQQKDLQNQITQRNMELAEEQRKKTQEEIEKKLKDAVQTKSPKEEEKDANAAKINALTTATLAMEEVSSLTRTKVRLEGEKNVAKSEIKMAMSYQGAAIESKINTVADKSQAVSKITNEITKEIKEAKEAMKESKEAEEERVKAKRSVEEEEKENNNQKSATTLKHIDIEL